MIRVQTFKSGIHLQFEDGIHNTSEQFSYRLISHFLTSGCITNCVKVRLCLGAGIREVEFHVPVQYNMLQCSVI